MFGDNSEHQFSSVALEVKSNSCRQPRLKYPFEIQDVARTHTHGASGALLPGRPMPPSPIWAVIS